MNAKDKMTSGRVRALFDYVFFGTLLMSLELKEMSEGEIVAFKAAGLPLTASTDGKRILYYPDFIESMSKPEVLFVLLHEISHVFLLHHTRRGARDSMVYNMAGDYVINLMLKNQGLTVPSMALFNEKFEGWSTEQVYDYLMANPDEQPKGGGSDGGSPTWDIGGVVDGKGEDGKPLQGEAKAAVEAIVKAKIRNAYNAAKKAGKLPAGMEDIIEDICVAKATWREILQSFITEKALTDYNWATVNTRMLHQYGIINPNLDGYKLGELAMIIDTSGSVSNEELQQYAGEINDVIENYEVKVTVVYCDTKVNRIDEFENGDPIVLHAVGRGGTRMEPAFNWVEDNIQNPAAVLLFSDSYLFDWGEIREPECPCLMACSSQDVDRDVPDWMEVIDIAS